MIITEKFLTPNKYSRPQLAMSNVLGIVIHYVANTNSSAMDNWNYFENRKFGKDSFGSAQFIIGIRGEILQTMPLSEKAYGCGLGGFEPQAIYKTVFNESPNRYTISIECCHIKDNGEMSIQTYESLVWLTKYLSEKYKLTKNNIYLHHDITTKPCHLWFVNNPNEWTKFKNLI